MKTLLLATLVLAMATAAVAHDNANISITDISRPDKPHQPVVQNVPGPRQGGDTILDAVLIALPVVNGTGSTVGFNDDYEEMCPWDGHAAPDVVYTFVPEYSMGINIDMLGSAYDTHIYVYDQDLNVIGCNDDYWPDYTSYLENVPVTVGQSHYLVIDGYGGQSGEYLLNISEFIPCVLECPAGAELEGEPEIVDGYVDEFNGGCNSTPVVYSQITSGVFCGKAGFYLGPNDLSSRDLDWFEVVVPEGGVLEIVGDAEEPLNLYQIEGDCDNLVIQNGGVAGPCQEFTLTITGTAGETVRVLAGATRFWEGATYEYDYVLLSNLGGVIAVEEASWSAVKALFD